jgi:methyl-accepting chemotaxis protein
VAIINEVKMLSYSHRSNRTISQVKNRKFSQLKLRSKILLGYLAPLLFLIITAVFVYIKADDVKQQMTGHNISETIVLKADRLAISIAGINQASRDYILNPIPENLQFFQKEKALSQTAAKSLKETVQNLPKKTQWNLLLQLAQKSLDFNQQLIDLAKGGKVKKAINLYQTDQQEILGHQLQDSLEKLTLQESEIQKTKNEALNWNLRFLLQLFLGAIIIAILVTIALGFFIAKLISDEIGNSTILLASSVAEIAAAAEEQEETTKEQVTAIAQVVTTLDELEASSRLSAEQAELAANGTRKALILVSGGSPNESISITGSSLRRQMGVIAERMMQLTSQLSQIGNISNVVSDIANQTNMLALNAAVEAVHAGEHGKGFTVVSSEIRRLADQTKQYAERIKVLTADIQTATQATGIATEDGNKIVIEVIEAMSHITMNVQQIALNARQQATATQQSAEVMKSLSMTSQQIANSISETQVGIQNLNQAAQNLKSMVDVNG